LEVLDKISGEAFDAIKRGDTAIDQLMEIKQLAWLVRKAGGEASLLVVNALSSGRAAPETMELYAGWVRTAEQTYLALEDLSSGPPLPPALTAAIQAAKRSYFDKPFLVKREQLLRQVVKGEKPDWSTEQYSKLSAENRESLIAVAIQALDSARDH